MKNRCINELERFDIRDHYWSLVSRTERDLRIHILEPGDSREFRANPSPRPLSPSVASA